MRTRDKNTICFIAKTFKTKLKNLLPTHKRQGDFAATNAGEDIIQLPAKIRQVLSVGAGVVPQLAIACQ